MSITEAIVIVAVFAILMLRKTFHSRHLAQAGYVTDRHGDPHPIVRNDDTEALRQEIAALRERIKVLERITIEHARPSDRSGTLADEIEALRR